jgi:hypothetical protein
MLLAKIPVLDKGFVALISSCNTTQVLREIDQEFFFGKYPTVLEELGSMTVVMKCPLFVQLDLSKFNFKIINAESAEVQPDAYIPNASQIGGSDIGTNQTISDDISRTTAALLINPIAYAADGSDHFISQVMTPINVYTTIIVQGSYKEWCAYAYIRKVPGPIKAYTMALQQIIDCEWK